MFVSLRRFKQKIWERKRRKENRQKKQGFQFGVCDNSLDKIDQAKPFWGKTFHQSWSEKNIADSAADDSVQRSVSSYARGVTCRNVPFAIYSLSLIPLEHRFKRRPYKYTRIEAGATTTKQFRSPGIEHFYPIPPPPPTPPATSSAYCGINYWVLIFFHWKRCTNFFSLLWKGSDKP